MSATTNIIELCVGDDVLNLNHGAVVLLKGDMDMSQTCESLRDADTYRVAFVVPHAKRSLRRLAASLALSDQFGCT